MPDYHENLLPDCLYHIYSRAVGDEKLFLSDENYHYFLSKFQQYISPIADVYTWCLLPNHFHFMIRIKSLEEINSYYLLKKKGELDFDKTGSFLMQCFSNFLNSYSKSFNKMYNRKGALFMDFMKRIKVNSDSQMGATAFYVHKNPVHHGYCKNMEDWRWSSYNSYLLKAPSQKASIELLEWFGGIEGFRKYHNQPIYLKNAVIVE